MLAAIIPSLIIRLLARIGEANSPICTVATEELKEALNWAIQAAMSEGQFSYSLPGQTRCQSGIPTGLRKRASQRGFNFSFFFCSDFAFDLNLLSKNDPLVQSPAYTQLPAFPSKHAS